METKVDQVTGYKGVKVKVVDFNADHCNYEYSPSTVEVKLSDGKSETLEYLIMSPSHIKIIKQHSDVYNKTLDVLTEMYTEHIKLVILGSEYPIYTIHYGLLFDCALTRFSGTGSKLTTYKVKKFVTELRFNSDYRCELKELIVTHKLEVMSLGLNKHIRLVGLENLVFISNGSIALIDYTLAKEDSNTLRLKHLDKPLITHKKIELVEELILENTCRIKDLPLKTLGMFNNLKKLTISKSVQTIENYNIEQIIRKTPDKRKYINTNSLLGTMGDNFDTDKIIWITMPD